MVINADAPRGVAAAVVWPVVLAVLTALAAAPAAATALETRTLSVGEFDRVYFRGAGTVRLSQGAVPRLTVRGHDALVEQVTVATRDGELHIDTPPAGRHLVLELTVADLVAFTSAGDGRIVGDDLRFDALTLEGSGAGSFDMQRLEARDFEVRGSGTTRFDLTGQVHNHVVSLSGTGAYRAVELISDCVTVQVDGSSDVRLWAEDALDVEVAGAASIRYAGSPRVEQRVSGIARVQRLSRIAI